MKFLLGLVVAVFLFALADNVTAEETNGVFTDGPATIQVVAQPSVMYSNSMDVIGVEIYQPVDELQTEVIGNRRCEQPESSGIFVKYMMNNDDATALNHGGAACVNYKKNTMHGELKVIRRTDSNGTNDYRPDITSVSSPAKLSVRRLC